VCNSPPCIAHCTETKWQHSHRWCDTTWIVHLHYSRHR
jgi:hypothetical protein